MTTATAVDVKAAAPGRRLLPYGSEVAAELAKGRHPNIRLYACRPDAWERAAGHRATFGPGTVLVLPVGADPLAVRWPRISSLIADVTGLPGADLYTLARALVQNGCRLAYLLDRTQPERNLRVVAKRAPR